MIKVVLFDLDDTLISEEQYILSGYYEVSNLLSKKFLIDHNEVYRIMIDYYNKGSKKVFNEVLEYFNIKYNENIINELIDTYRNHSPKIELLEDSKGILSYLLKSRKKIGLITDGYKETQTKKIEVLNLEKYFDKIIVTDELGRAYWKPHPKSFEIMKAHFGVNYNEMVYVGDNPQKDFFIKKKYPIKTIRIIRHNGIYLDRPYLDDIQEDIRINSLEEIKKLLTLKEWQY